MRVLHVCYSGTPTGVHISRYVTVSHGISRYLTVSHGRSRGLTICRGSGSSQPQCDYGSKGQSVCAVYCIAGPQRRRCRLDCQYCIRCSVRCSACDTGDRIGTCSTRLGLHRCASQTHAHTRLHSYSRMCTYMCVCTPMHVCMHHTYTHSFINTYVHTYIHTHIPTYLPTYLHTYMHTYIHTHSPLGQSSASSFPVPRATGCL